MKDEIKVAARCKKAGKGCIRFGRNILSVLGPGLITGASDDDPSGIATYSQVGARFGYQMLWTMPFTYPFMGGIQEISARIGRVTGHGIAGSLRRYYSSWFAYTIVGLMVIANTINISADIAAMGAAVKLLMGGPQLLYAFLLTAFSVMLQVFVPYTRYVHLLKWLTLALFSYFGTIMIVNISWRDVVTRLVFPSLSLNSDYLLSLIAVFGTTISPYLFFWQASQEGEEVATHPKEHPLKYAPHQAPFQFVRIRVDTFVGMAFSNLVAFAIILAAASTLNVNGIREIKTAAEAAEALRPIAGDFAFLLFSLGIIGTGLLALPVLAGSAAYAAGETFRWRIGLEKKPLRAKGFYVVIIVALFGGFGLNLLKIDPIKALFWAAVINGLVAVPVMIVMMVMASNPRVMGRFVVPAGLKILGWLATLLMGLAAAGLLFTW